MDKKKVLIVMGGSSMGVGGIESMVMNYYRRLDMSKFCVDFVFFGEGVGLYDDEIYAKGGRIFHLPIKSKHPIGSYMAMKKLLLTERYDVVHANLNAAGICSALRIAKQCGVPVRVSHAHSSNHGTQNKIRWAINDFSRKNITKYSTHNFACSPKAGEWYYGDRPYVLVRNAIDTEKFLFDSEVRTSIRKEMGVENAIVIGHVGELGYPKNQAWLLEAFAKLIKMDSKAVLWLVGEGQDREFLAQYAKNLGVSDKVNFLGRRNDVNKLLQAMDVFVLPSFFEGFPVVVAEAVASDLPCVVSDAICSSVAISNKVHMLSLDQNSDEWAEAILKNSESSRSDNRELMEKSGFDVGIESKKLANFYENGRFE